MEPTLAKDAPVYNEEHPEDLQVDHLIAHSAILMEADSGRVIFEKNAYDIMYPASTTKVMTLYLGIAMLDDLERAQAVTVSDQAMNIPDDSSTMGLHAGEVISYNDVLYGTMMLSGNDGANVIAETVSGSVEAFVDLMNRAAGIMGCQNTHFVNAHGYHDDNHYTTAYDLALMTREAMQLDLFRDIVATTSKTIGRTNISRARTITTRSTILLPGSEESPNKYYYPYATGVKTGFHSAAGYCYIGSASKDGVNLISVVLYTSNRGRWTDTKKLFDYGFSQYLSITPIELYNMNPITIETSNYSTSDADMGRVVLTCVAADSSGGVRITATRDEIDMMASNLRSTVLISYDRSFAAPVEAGEVMGTMTYFDDNGKNYDYYLIASRSVNRRENAPKTIDEIYAAALADPSVLPPMSFRLVLVLSIQVLALVILVILIWLLVRLFRNRGFRFRK